MELVLSGLNCKLCLIYLDDVIIYGGNFYDVLDRLKTVWQQIREAHLKLKTSKCCLAAPTLSRCEASNGSSGGDQHLGEVTALPWIRRWVDPPLLTACEMDG